MTETMFINQLKLQFTFTVHISSNTVKDHQKVKQNIPDSFKVVNGRAVIEMTAQKSQNKNTLCTVLTHPSQNTFTLQEQTQHSHNCGTICERPFISP